MESPGRKGNDRASKFFKKQMNGSSSSSLEKFEQWTIIILIACQKEQQATKGLGFSGRKAELRTKESGVRSSNNNNDHGKFAITKLSVKVLTQQLKETHS